MMSYKYFKGLRGGDILIRWKLSPLYSLKGVPLKGKLTNMVSPMQLPLILVELP